ncbi:MAG: 50S ribosomal protein L18 [Candidatus Beckwithbacteria bacterium GW2011_GWB1_47_15]|uniref:Large ribosomal subunit protein uL18 n=1 Tax=Candidatus Beckwithbacteria bacterium GW2011_GWB1_47_15 TaxID=1618371 RepID=A0A0G1RX65_9BACT|nr:MAG: 50S ribosomal protein L18, large subunit ribosomal protein L18 [Candidatus Beckwithbacteria bacterium GW2011_GWC1_49_16]AQS30758.1 hypothetical protein [uncultured bacterium]KKU35945.1 MAG: 50S ribosomal protein L18 [Candidatus Beckwithbacteria bacterium GW2011_GWA1_46_30]KKU61909.1 MAG: 50S ribosomal protein L18 [Candidatus Beckwithbacteria bacterium GW2011_GWB1_47_15]KKU72537.1 MAG: 50S ribosomal protein L18 [Candidatus Beckwithbacteria bacterium GW2011_GWA2_47_25]KKW04296.1 MAG: 50S
MQQRKLRVRAKIRRVNLPRLSVFRSGKQIYAQIIEPKTGNILASASSLKLKKTAAIKKTKLAESVGEAIAAAAKPKKIIKVVFDRGGFRYHGRVKALAEAARKGGLKF